MSDTEALSVNEYEICDWILVSPSQAKGFNEATYVARCHEENLSDVVPARARTEQEQGEIAANMEVETLPKDIDALREEIHFARARALKAWQEYLQAQQWLAPVEKGIRQHKDQTAVNCFCSQCIEWSQTSDDATSHYSDASSDIPSVAEEYFQLECEAFVSDERLAELDFEHREAEAAHEHTLCQDQDQGIALEEYESLYQRKRQELVDALAVAHYRLHARRNACLAQGIDPERFRYRQE